MFDVFYEKYEIPLYGPYSITLMTVTISLHYHCTGFIYIVKKLFATIYNDIVTVITE